MQNKQVFNLITEGDLFYARALQAIRKAQRTIFLTMYIFRDDAIGRLFQVALQEKAQQGVKVILIVDAIGSLSLSNNIFNQMQKLGVEVYLFHPWMVIQKFWFSFLIRRNHRKILIVDQELAFTGGFNIMKECSLKHYGQKRWLDYMVYTSQRQTISELTWQFYDTLWRSRYKKWAFRKLQKSKNQVIFANQFRAKAYPLSKWLKRKLRRAKTQIVIVVPYFIPYGFFWRILIKQAKAGVKVEIILSQVSDLKYINSISFYLARKLLKYGVKVRLYQGEDQVRFNHTKYFRFDNVSVTGSANYDYRSFVLNLETLVAFRITSSSWHQQYQALVTNSINATKAELPISFRAYLMLPFKRLL